MGGGDGTPGAAVPPPHRWGPPDRTDREREGNETRQEREEREMRAEMGVNGAPGGGGGKRGRPPHSLALLRASVMIPFGGGAERDQKKVIV